MFKKIRNKIRNKKQEQSNVDKAKPEKVDVSKLSMDKAMDILKAKTEELQPIDTVPYRLTALITEAVTVTGCAVAGAYYGGTAIVAALGLAGAAPTVFLGAAGLMVGGFVGGIVTVPVAAVTLGVVAIYKGHAKKFLSHIKNRMSSRKQVDLDVNELKETLERVKREIEPVQAAQNQCQMTLIK